VEPLAAARAAIGVGALLVAARFDVRTRRVPDPLWLALGTAGLLLLTYEILGSATDLERIALVPAAAVLFYAVFFGETLLDESGLHLRPLRLAGFGLAAALIVGSSVVAFRDGDSTGYASLLAVPAMILIYQGFYQVGLIHGGADAKAMIALTLLVPTYPSAAPFPLLTLDPRIDAPMRLSFPFSLVVFVDAAILYLVVPLAFLVLNALRGDLRLPQALFGYRASLDAVPKNTWLMERIDETGQHVLVLLPRRGRDPTVELQRLRDAGHRRAWVQPKIPFMVPLAAGFAVAFFLGNLLGVILPR